MDLINRYVYAVIRSLPEKQRGDIEKELRALIEDMIEENDSPETYEDKVRTVLLELGDPEVLADNYRGSKRYLIGPKYFDKYILILKIVLGAVFIGVSVAMFFGSFFDAQKNVKDIVTGYFDAVFSGLLQAFAWVTVGFVIAERNTIYSSKDIETKDKWDLSQLPHIPNKKAMIPISEPIVSIIFNTIFTALLYYTPELFAAYIDGAVIPVFNADVMLGYRALLISILVVGVLKDALKLYFRRWNLRLSVILAVLSVLSTILVASMFTNNEIWNSGFPGEITNQMNLTFDFTGVWERIKTGFVAVIVLTGVIDVITAIYKGFKYNTVK